MGPPCRDTRATACRLRTHASSSHTEERESSSSGCLVGKEDWPCLACSPPSLTPPCFFLPLPGRHRILQEGCVPVLFFALPPAVLDACFFFFFSLLHGRALSDFKCSSNIPRRFTGSLLLLLCQAWAQQLHCSTPACWFRARYVCQVCDRVTCAEYVYVSV